MTVQSKQLKASGTTTTASQAPSAMTSFPDALTRANLRVSGYLSLTARDITSIYVEAYKRDSVIGIEMFALQLEFRERRKGEETEAGYTCDCVPPLWELLTNDYHLMRHDAGVPYPKHGDYAYFVIRNRCHEMVSLSLEIARFITKDENWRIVSNNHHSMVYNDKTEQVFDIMADVNGDAPFEFPEASCEEEIQFAC